MEKDKSPVNGGGVVGGGGGGGSGGGVCMPPPPSSRYTAYASSSGGFMPAKSDASSSSSSQDTGGFSYDISRMPECPPRNVGHRRAQSEILSLPDDLSFDNELGVVGGEEGPALSDDTVEDLLSMYMEMDKFASSSAISGLDFSMSKTSGTGMVDANSPAQTENVAAASIEKPRVRHQHSQSMDGSTSIKSEALTSGTDAMSLADAKKAMSAAKLADLALIDPKRAKRIWANRQSAARSKERKMRYISELERKVQTMQTEATTLSTHLTLLQRDNTGLSAENSELKLRLQTVEQQVRLQDALNDALREEVQRLKIVTGQAVPNGGQMMNFGQSSFGVNQHYHHNQAMLSLLAAQQLQQLQIHSQNQQQMPTQRLQHLQQAHQASSADTKFRGVINSHVPRDGNSDGNILPE